jgi:hypothetical protein
MVIMKNNLYKFSVLILLLFQLSITQIYLSGDEDNFPKSLDIILDKGEVIKVKFDKNFKQLLIGQRLGTGNPILPILKSEKLPTMFSPIMTNNYQGIEPGRVKRIKFLDDIKYAPTKFDYYRMNLKNSQNVRITDTNNEYVDATISILQKNGKFIIDQIQVIQRKIDETIPREYLNSTKEFSQFRTIRVINKKHSIVSNVSLTIFTQDHEKWKPIKKIVKADSNVEIPNKDYKELRLTFTYNGESLKTDPIPVNQNVVTIDDNLLRQKTNREVFQLKVSSPEKYSTLNFIYNDKLKEEIIVNNSVEIQGIFDDMRHGYLTNKFDASKKAVIIENNLIKSADDITLVIIDFNSTFGHHKKHLSEFRNMVKLLYDNTSNINILLYKYMNIIPNESGDFSKYNINEIVYHSGSNKKHLNISNYDSLRIWIKEDGAISEDEIREKLFVFEPIKSADTLGIEHTINTLEDMSSNQYCNNFIDDLNMSGLISSYSTKLRKVIYISYYQRADPIRSLDTYNVEYHSFNKDLDNIKELFSK